MNNRISCLLKSVKEKEHHGKRHPLDIQKIAVYRDKSKNYEERTAKRLELILREEAPIVSKAGKIVFQRTVIDVPPVFSDEECLEFKKTHFIHELGNVSNICPDYESLISLGFKAAEKKIRIRKEICEKEKDIEGINFLSALLLEISAVNSLCMRYKEEALRVGNEHVVKILSTIPENPATSFNEALQFFRIIHYVLWAEGEYHNTIGRFDCYMYPYLKKDLAEGKLTVDEAFELLEEFFISFNIDSDIYPGVQQGDDGQSLMLGGCDENGNDCFNKLSEMCLKASCELMLIDPKINLRVNRNTARELYIQGTYLTRTGLGFPQYSNDDIVIPGLIQKGYSPKDAANYTVAACWEFIIPNNAMDIVNIAALSFPSVILKALDNIEQYNSFAEFMSHVKEVIRQMCDQICNSLKNLYIFPAPFMSLAMDGCIEKARDISNGSTYNNYGIHGTGISTAADSLIAIKKYIYDEKSLSVKELKTALNTDFKGYDELLSLLRYNTPKMGCGEEEVDSLACELLDSFADNLEGKRNERGGIFRPGTGSAMFYISHAREISATPDGRRKNEPFAANYSPSLYVRTPGPMTVVKSFTKYNLKRTINGGPLTLEFHQNVFRTDSDVEKIADFVKSYIDIGGHQLQLNSVSREILRKACENPGEYKNLIVRVWGWSAYFCELDDEYKDHLINRQEYGYD